MDLSRCQVICIETAVHALAKAEPLPRDLVGLLWEGTGRVEAALFRARPAGFIACGACKPPGTPLL